MLKLCESILLVLSTVSLMGQMDTDTVRYPGLANDTILLEEVTVSLLPFHETYQEAAGGIHILNVGSLDPKFTFTTTDLINLVPGVHMASGTYNTNRLVIRGVGSRTPYNTNRIRAYLDDIPLTTGDGISTMEDLDLHGIGSIEILKGPSSALYGAGLGGVVRLNSPYPGEEGFITRISGEAGSFHTGRFGITSSYKRDRVALQAGITRSFSEGYRENSQYLRNNAFLNMRYFGDRNTLSLTFALVDLFAEIPSSLNESDFKTQPWAAARNWLGVKGHEKYLKLLGGVKIESRLSDRLHNHLVLFSSFTDPYESRPFNILDDQSTSVGFREYLQYETSSISLNVGAEYFHEWYQWKIHETEAGSAGDLLSDHQETRKYLNTFALFQWKPNTRVIIHGGLNLNILHYSLETVYMSDSTDQTGSYGYKPVLSPRIGISYKHHKRHHLYASAGHGFSAPSLEETLLPEGDINTELKPESGWNLEVGNRGRTLQGRFRYDVTLYAIFLKDLLVTERITEDIFTGANAGKALNTGLELWVQWSLRSSREPQPFNVHAALGYNLANHRFLEFIDDGEDFSKNVLPGIPSQKLNSILTGEVGTLDIKTSYSYTGGQWIDDGNTQRSDGYHLLNLQVSWDHAFSSLPISFEIHGGIRNLLNSRHASMILINAPSFGGRAPRYYYPGLPRRFYLGTTVTFK